MGVTCVFNPPTANGLTQTITVTFVTTGKTHTLNRNPAPSNGAAPIYAAVMFPMLEF